MEKKQEEISFVDYVKITLASIIRLRTHFPPKVQFDYIGGECGIYMCKNTPRDRETKFFFFFFTF
jgi:hypothetical protein